MNELTLTASDLRSLAASIYSESLRDLDAHERMITADYHPEDCGVTWYLEQAEEKRLLSEKLTKLANVHTVGAFDEFTIKAKE